MSTSVSNIVDFNEKFRLLHGGKEAMSYRKKDTVNKTKTMTPLTIEEVEKIKGCLWAEVVYATTQKKKLQRARNYVLFITSINVGLRASDLTALRFSDLFNGEDMSMKDDVMITQTKTKKNHRLAINDSVKNVFEWYLKEFNINTSSNTYIFESQEGGKITTRRMDQILKEFARKAGVDRTVATHTPRKTYARQLIEQNRGDVDVLEYLRVSLGHSNNQSLSHYTCIDEDRYIEKVKELNL